MEYFAGLDVSMEETHICILDREGVLVREGKASSTPKMIAAFLTDGPICAKVVFETGRMAPMLYHGLAELGAPVACIESRQAYQALKSLAGIRQIAMMHGVWRIWRGPDFISRPMLNFCRRMQFVR